MDAISGPVPKANLNCGINDGCDICHDRFSFPGSRFPQRPASTPASRSLNPVFRPPHPRCHPQPRLAGAANSAARQEAGESAHRAAWRGGRLLPSSPPGLRYRGPQLPHAAAPRGKSTRIGWSPDVPCFIEVKTRTSRDVKTPAAAVDRHKRREIAAVAREYLRRQPPACQWRFDIVSVYYRQSSARQPQIEVFRNASLSA